MKRILLLSLWFIAANAIAQAPNNPGGNSNYYDLDNIPAPDDPVTAPQNYPPVQQQRDNYAPPQTPTLPQNNYNNAPPQQNYNNASQVNYASPSYQTFYDDLSPYGYWVNYPNYGYAWVPNVGADFRPYCSNGQWLYTSYGWTWASNYNWGWAPFHYGRWTYDGMYGWIWIPGNEWAPAWVAWGQSNGYYGWAPIGPGVTAYDGYRPAEHYWNYCPAQNFTQQNVSNYTFNSYSSNRVEYVNSNNMTIINNSNAYNNTRYASGPQQAEVERVTGTRVNTVTVNETSKPSNGGGNANQLNLYRPNINSSTAHTGAPVKVVPVENLKPVNNNSRTVQQNEPVNHSNQLPPDRGQPVQNNERFNPENHQNNPSKKNEPPVNLINQSHQVAPQKQLEPVKEESSPNNQFQQAPQPQKKNSNNNNGGKPNNNQGGKPVKQQPHNAPPPAPKKKQ